MYGLLFILMILGLSYFGINKVNASSNHWTGKFYNNTDLNGPSINQNYTSLKLNWDRGVPVQGIRSDNFSASFTKQIDGSKEYFVQTYADDGIRVSANGKFPINEWHTSAGELHRGLITDLNEGLNTVQVDYFEKGGRAFLFADIVPLDQWLAYYYSTTTPEGPPTNTIVYESSNLSLDHGYHSPISNIPKDNYSARYVTAKRLPAGEYIIRTKVDDGVKVFVDGKLVIDRWTGGNYVEDAIKISINDHSTNNTSEKNIHFIEVLYLEKTGKSKIDVSIQPLNNVIPSDSWLGVFYKNEQLNGNGVAIGGTGSNSPVSQLKFNWGYNSPNKLIAPNNFSASFYKKINGNTDYFVQTYADDGIRVTVNGKSPINEWQTSAGELHRGIITGLGSGSHNVQVDYFERGGKAFVYADVVPINQWLAYYYPSTNPNGVPVNSRVIQAENLSLDYGYNSPMSNVPKDNFSARFVTAKRLPAGEYVIRTQVDDGVRVYIDGKLVIDRWTGGNFVEDAVKINISDRNTNISAEKNIHFIEVLYLEKTGKSKINVSIAPVFQAIPTNSWLGTFYPNEQLTGLGVVSGGNGSINSISQIKFNWGKNSPIKNINADNFSASFIKKISGNQDYFVQTFADDGVRVSVNGKKPIDKWHTSAGELHQGLITGLGSGHHDVQVDYFERGGNAFVYADVVPLNHWLAYYYPTTTPKGVPANTKVYGTDKLSLDFGYNSPMPNVPKDNFSARYVTAKRLPAGKYLIKAKVDDGVRIYVDGKRVIDRWTGGNYVENAVVINIEDRNTSIATEKDIHFIEIEYLEKSGKSRIDFSIQLSSEGYSYLNLDLRKPSNITAQEIRNFFDRKGHPNSQLKNYAQHFIDAANKYGVNATYLVAHAIWETGWGGSDLINYKNNLYGYGAYDLCPFTCGYYFPTVQDSINFVAYQVKKDYLSANGAYFNGYDLIGMNIKYATDPNWKNGISRLMQDMKPYDFEYYYFKNPISSNGPTPPVYGRNIPDGEPVPTNIVYSYPQSIKGKVTETVNFRNIPYLSQSSIIGSITNGSEVEVLGYNTDVTFDPKRNDPYAYRWYRVKYNGQEGWVNGQYLTFNEPKEVLIQVNSSIGLNVRSEPVVGAKILTALSDKQIVYGVLDSNGNVVTQNGWFKIYLPGSTNTGWISGEFSKIISN